MHGMWLDAYQVIIQHQGLQIHHGAENVCGMVPVKFVLGNVSEATD